MNPRDIESILHIKTLKLGSKGRGDSILVLMHVTYLVHLLCTDFCSGLGSAPPATAHAHNVFHSETKSKVLPKKLSRSGIARAKKKAEIAREALFL